MQSSFTCTLPSKAHSYHHSLFTHKETEVQRLEGIWQTWSQLLANHYINSRLLSLRCFVLLSHRCFPPKDKMNIPTVTHLEFLNPLLGWKNKIKTLGFKEMHYKSFSQSQVILKQRQRRDLGWLLIWAPTSGPCWPFPYAYFPKWRSWKTAWAEKYRTSFLFILGGTSVFQLLIHLFIPLFIHPVFLHSCFIISEARIFVSLQTILENYILSWTFQRWNLKFIISLSYIYIYIYMFIYFSLLTYKVSLLPKLLQRM